MRLLLVRHGATAHNAERRFTGQTDVPLSQLGHLQAEALAAALAGERFDVVLSSDLSRARQTAETILRHVDGPLRLEPHLREFSMGAWEGRAYTQIGAAAPAELEALARWGTSPDLALAPGGESPVQVRDRAGRVIARCLDEHPGGRVLCVTHGGVIGVLICHLLAIDLTLRRRFRYDNAAMTELDIGPDTGATLMRLNDTCHLRHLPIAEETQVL